MKLFLNLIACGVLLLLSGPAAMSQSIQTDYDHTFPLAKLRTFNFIQQERGPKDPLAASPINDRRIHDALNSQLTQNGFTESSQADFLIGYVVTTKQALDIQDNRYGWLQRRGTIDVEQLTSGTLIVVFVDARTNQEVWRGYATGTINPKNLNNDVNKAVTKLVQKFKKNQAGKN
jgi:hypothetical protein